MRNNLVLFAVAVIIAAILQVSVAPLPFGMLVILIWFLRQKEANLAFLVIIFSMSLAIVSNTPMWLILASTTVSLYLFVIAKAALPSKVGISLSLFFISLVAWEAFSVTLSKIASL